MGVSRGRLFIAAGLVVAVGIAAFLFLRNGAADATYITATVDRGDVVDVVGATGLLQAVTTVQVGSQVSGTVQSLYADFNSVVTKGQVLARLDPSLFQARLGQAQASLMAARANVDRSRAEAEDTRQKLARAEQLTREGLLPQADLDAARSNHAGAAAQVKASQAAVTQAAANVRQVEVDMTHTVIKAPIDGVVVARSVDVGQTVAASLQAPVLFVIANDLRRMQVSASIDEADVGRVHAGQEATFRVDAYPNEVFTGRLEQVRLQPITAQNVVTYNTIVGVDNPGQRLMPGMTATVSVIVRKSENVLRVPASALRFRPEGFTGPGRGGAGGAALSGAGAGQGGAAPRVRAAVEGGATQAESGGRRRRRPDGTAGEERPAAAGASGERPAGRSADAERGGGQRAMVFVPDAKGAPEPRPVRIGISDGQFVEIADGLTEGAAVITGVAGEAGARGPGRPGASPGATNPFAPAPQRRSR